MEGTTEHYALVVAIYIINEYIREQLFSISEVLCLTDSFRMCNI